MPPKFYKSFLDFHNNKATYKDFLGVHELAFITFSGLFFLVFNPFYFGKP
jgi:hypothetical protein